MNRHSLGTAIWAIAAGFCLAATVVFALLALSEEGEVTARRIFTESESDKILMHEQAMQELADKMNMASPIDDKDLQGRKK